MAENVVAVVGLISSGKTTLVNEIERTTLYHVLKESIEHAWRDLFYEDRREFTEYFEMDTLSKRIANHIIAKRGEGVFFLDTEMIWARETYVRQSFDEGYLSFEGLENYDRMMKQALDMKLGRTKEEAARWMPKMMVRLIAKPDISYERQRKRMKEEDEFGEIIPREYFSSLESYNSRFFENIDEIYMKLWHLPFCPRILNVDANRDIAVDKGYLDGTMKRIIEELKKVNGKSSGK